MNFITSIDIKKMNPPIQYGDKLFLIGSCFTEHIGNALGDLKFAVLQNPHGILFDPLSVCNSLVSYIEKKVYEKGDLFLLNELWNSWEHHSRFSNMDASQAIANINQSQEQAHTFLQQADWLIITLGSSFSYRLTSKALGGGIGNGVANCHRAPARWFDKQLMEIKETVSLLDTVLHRLKQFNPSLKIIFTISPVRHLRDGVVDNNRSKARLLEAVHHLVKKLDNIYYFPAYELVIDVLRDYRFYDIDLAHPNYMATEFVMNHFKEACISPEAQNLMEELRKIAIAKRHKSFHPATQAHQQFLHSHYEKVKNIQEKYPSMDFKEELAYFSSGS